jgi:nicotinamide mononucleotide (NMN) deamidase PncC
MKAVSPKTYHIKSAKTVMLGLESQLLKHHEAITEADYLTAILSREISRLCDADWGILVNGNDVVAPLPPYGNWL